MLALLFAALLPFVPGDQVLGAPTAPLAQPLIPARTFSQLFTTAPPAVQPGSSTGADAVRPAPKSKVVCGMTVMMVDGSADPKFALAPKGHGELPIGRMPKPMCGNREQER